MNVKSDVARINRYCFDDSRSNIVVTLVNTETPILDSAKEGWDKDKYRNRSYVRRFNVAVYNRDSH